MKNNTVSNPYAQQVLAQGRDLSNAPAPKREYPRTVGLRTFQTEEEYQEALADFLNGYWYQLGNRPLWTPSAEPMPYHCLMNKTEMFNSALESLQQFIMETDADWCMVYDFMEAQVGTLTEPQWDEVEMLYFNYNNDTRFWV